MKQYLKFFLPVLIVGVIAVPLSAGATMNIGLNMANNAASTAGYGNATLGVAAGRIIQIVLNVLALVATVIIIAGGVMWMASGGKEDQIDKAKKLMTAAIIGLVIVLLAKAIAFFLLERLANLSNAA